MNRQSIESDRVHLLAPESLPPSALASRAPSLLSRTSSTATLKAQQTQTKTQTQTPSSSTATTQPLTKSATAARRFTKSEEEYLNALRAWVEDKQYVSLGEDLEGFYGRKTMDMYAAQPGPNWGRKKRSKSSANQTTPEDLDCNGRRRTIAAVVPARVEEENRVEAPRRMSVRAWLVRR